MVNSPTLTYTLSLSLSRTHTHPQTHTYRHMYELIALEKKILRLRSTYVTHLNWYLVLIVRVIVTALPLIFAKSLLSKNFLSRHAASEKVVRTGSSQKKLVRLSMKNTLAFCRVLHYLLKMLWNILLQ